MLGLDPYESSANSTYARKRLVVVRGDAMLSQMTQAEILIVAVVVILAGLVFLRAAARN